MVRETPTTSSCTSSFRSNNLSSQIGFRALFSRIPIWFSARSNTTLGTFRVSSLRSHPVTPRMRLKTSPMGLSRCYTPHEMENISSSLSDSILDGRLSWIASPLVALDSIVFSNVLLKFYNSTLKSGPLTAKFDAFAGATSVLPHSKPGSSSKLLVLWMLQPLSVAAMFCSHHPLLR